MSPDLRATFSGVGIREEQNVCPGRSLPDFRFADVHRCPMCVEPDFLLTAGFGPSIDVERPISLNLLSAHSFESCLPI